jgi:2-oxoglutarate dehydrogenase E1 component
MEREVDSSNLAFLETLYQDYQQNPASIPAEWLSYFHAVQAEPPGANGPVLQREPTEGAPVSELASFFLRAVRFLRTYRERGHLVARIDPLERERHTPPELDPSFFGLSKADLDRPVPVELGAPTLRAVLEQYKARYGGTVGIEYGHLDDPAVRNWIEARLTAGFARPTVEQKRKIHERLMQATLFEEFLQKKYLGAKTFSLEGTESLIPLLDLTIENAARLGVVEVVMGMAHRGRLNVLANLVKKPMRDIFLEFEEHFPEGYSGDVKYHLGYSNDLPTPYGRVHLSLNFNPSHLEFVAPVAMGRTRAKQDRFGDYKRERGMLLLIHGDAAFIGEGIVQETLNISGIAAYTVGGAVHIILNNQVGFTTEPHEYTAGRYATEIAKMLEAPIFHVNAEDPDALVGVVELAMDFRKEFKRDVFIDLIGYRKRGHNETDEPSFTQPEMYRRIAAKKPLHMGYLARLESEGIRSKAESNTLAKQYQDSMEAAFSGARREPTPTRPPAEGGLWKGYIGGPEEGVPEPETGVQSEKLSALMAGLNRFPQGFNLHPKLVKFVEGRREMGQNKRPLDWASAELLAFATLAVEGHRVRVSGQDVVRGTFTQRHGGYTDHITGERYLPANHLAEGQAPVELHNSALSEAGVLGFEYGYSLDMPDALVAWEAQYGDFVNTAQVIVDQFIASAEAKWNRLSGIVLLLPHGMEGGGPEHSSARLERFLQLCSNDNMQVVYPTTPAQYFHLLRRQVLRPWRKPLVVMTPKSLLRNPEAVSKLDELAQGRFQRVLYSTPGPKIKRVVLCSGKVYYDLEAARRTAGKEEVAIVRLEQLYPFPMKELQAALALYSAKAEVVWTQEEPANMGAWWFIRARFGDRIFGHHLGVVARQASSSPAVGSKKVHDKEQQTIVRQALGI